MVLDLELLQSESTECWGGLVEGLIERGLKRPCLVIIDGNKGLRAGVEKNWPGIEVQRLARAQASFSVKGRMRG